MANHTGGNIFTLAGALQKARMGEKVWRDDNGGHGDDLAPSTPHPLLCPTRAARSDDQQIEPLDSTRNMKATVKIAGTMFFFFGNFLK